MFVQGIERVVFVVEHPGPAFEDDLFDTGDLEHRTARHQASPQHGDPALRRHGVGHRVDHVLVGGKDDSLQVFSHRGTGDGHRIPVEQTGFEQCGHDGRHAADAVQINHVVTPEWAQVAEVRDASADAVEVLQGEVDAGLGSDGQQVEDGIGRSAERHHHSDRVFECWAGEDVAWGDTGLHEAHHRLAGTLGVFVEPVVDRRDRGASR